MGNTIVNNMIESFDSQSKPGSKKIGLFFGSFNPIHIGHLLIANHMVEQTDLEEIWFVVSPHNPHKKKASLLDDYHRLAIVKEAIDDNPKFKSSDIEFSLDQPSYTVETLAHLKEKHPTYQFSILMGEDNLRSFHKWKNYEVILKDNPIFIYPRVLTVQELEPKKSVEENELINHPNITLTDAPVMKVSSSLIRGLIKDGKSIKYLMTEPARQYVEDMNFYR
jgi:nicotinate-nucleotide adenylyltransferase